MKDRIYTFEHLSSHNKHFYVTYSGNKINNQEKITDLSKSKKGQLLHR